MYDVCVIGCGVSGMCAAIAAARQGKNVIILDKNNKPGKKIYATGNGRCNITNRNIDFKAHYNSTYERYEDFLKIGLGEQPCDQVMDFMNSLGVLTTNLEYYIYPASMQASTVVWAMLDEIKRLGVTVICEAKVNDIAKDNNSFSVNYNDNRIESKNIILACGGATYAKLGGSNLGYELAKIWGHKITALRPALGGLNTYEVLKDVAGVRVKANAKVICDGVKGNESGELQINEYGLSGIMIFNLSSLIGGLIDDKKKVSISLDLLPDIDEDKFMKIVANKSHRTIIGMFNGIINDKLATYIINKCQIDGKTLAKTVAEDKLLQVYKSMKEFVVNIKSLRDIDSGQVTAGGVCLDEINPNDFGSKICPGLYIVGEMLDIDGLCGGYNITFAILSGIRAGKSI